MIAHASTFAPAKPRRTRKNGPSPILSKEELGTVACSAAALALKEEQCLTELNELISKAKEEYKAKIEDLRKQRAEHEKRLEAWALTHRTEFDGKQSMTVCGHSLKFRLSPGKIKLATDEETLMIAVENFGEEFANRYLRTETVFNTALANDTLSSNDPLLFEEQERLRELGVSLVQNEKFTFVPDFETAKDIKPE